MIILAAAVLIFVVMLAATATLNFVVLPRMTARDVPMRMPRVSVLVPARNEERSIDACVRSLVAQEYEDLEIIVLDDNSDDRTAEILALIAAGSPRLRVLQGAPLPAGWVGKCFACHQLAQQATGELLLFTDADTVHAPQAVRSAVAHRERQRADLFTVIPLEVMNTWWERTLLPFLHFSFMAYLPLPLVWGTRREGLAMANGQFMLFRREAYDALGGHAALRTKIVEDIEFGRAAKRAGMRIGVGDATEIVRCRMYATFAEVWNGFSKNLYPGFGTPPAFLAGMASIALGSIVPFVMTAWWFVDPRSVPVTFVVASLLILAVRIALAYRFRLSILHALLHPIASAIVIAIGFNSWRLVRGAGPRWKGRSYPGIDAADQPVSF